MDHLDIFWVLSAVFRKSATRTPKNAFIINVTVSVLLLCLLTVPLTLVQSNQGLLVFGLNSKYLFKCTSAKAQSIDGDYIAFLNHHLAPVEYLQFSPRLAQSIRLPRGRGENVYNLRHCPYPWHTVWVH